MAKQTSKSLIMVVGQTFVDSVAVNANTWHTFDMVVPFVEARSFQFDAHRIQKLRRTEADSHLSMLGDFIGAGNGWRSVQLEDSVFVFGSGQDVSIGIDGILQQNLHRDVFDRGDVSGSQSQFGGHAGVERFQPAGQTQAPAIPGLESGKAILRHWCRQIVAGTLRELQELRGHHSADGVHAVIVATGFAFARPEETGQRISRTDHQIFTKDILGQSDAPLKIDAGHLVSEQRSASSTFVVYSLISMRANAGGGILSRDGLVTRSGSRKSIFHRLTDIEQSWFSRVGRRLNSQGSFGNLEVHQTRAAAQNICVPQTPDLGRMFEELCMPLHFDER
jgi:hypothetical protein